MVRAVSVWGGKRSSSRGGKGLSRAGVRDGVWGGEARTGSTVAYTELSQQGHRMLLCFGANIQV